MNKIFFILFFDGLTCKIKKKNEIPDQKSGKNRKKQKILVCENRLFGRSKTILIVQFHDIINVGGRIGELQGDAAIDTGEFHGFAAFELNGSLHLIIF